MPTKRNETAISVTAFKGQCLALIDAVARGKASRVVLTRRGHPVRLLSLISSHCRNSGEHYAGLSRFHPTLT
jgi:antitoxin (DNA-binding transcriptional repressor) of toxin-antitoxin stability system